MGTIRGDGTPREEEEDDQALDEAFHFDGFYLGFYCLFFQVFFTGIFSDRGGVFVLPVWQFVTTSDYFSPSSSISSLSFV